MLYRSPYKIRDLRIIVCAILLASASQWSVCGQVVVPPPSSQQVPAPVDPDPMALPTAPPSNQLYRPTLQSQQQPQMALSEILGEADLRPHRNIDRLPPLWPYYLVFGILGFVILLLGILYFLRLNRRPKPAPFIPADVRALNALDAVRPLIAEAKAREFSYRTSEIIRAYIEERFGIEARNRTTREFLSLAARSDSTLPSRYEGPLNEFLHYCDLAKFAKQVMQPKQLESMFDSAKQFISDTRPSIMAMQTPETSNRPEAKEVKA